LCVHFCSHKENGAINANENKFVAFENYLNGA